MEKVEEMGKFGVNQRGKDSNETDTVGMHARRHGHDRGAFNCTIQKDMLRQ